MNAPPFLQQHAQEVHASLEHVLNKHRSGMPDRLWEAMRYSLLAGGKRIRPVLLMETYRVCGGQAVASIMPAAVGLECVHTYSLIQDDLPCMDDDSLRRGMPTCHCQFDQATALLASDALLTLAFQLLAEAEWPAAVRVELCRRLAIASGGAGMVGGQMLDIEADSQSINNELEIERIHVQKTGALICYACEAGALLAGADETRIEHASRFGRALGLLFQVTDDILDVTSSTDILGKSAGKDQRQQKATYVSILGLSRTQELADEWLAIALEAACQLGDKNGHLTDLAQYVRNREH
ncbi:MAG: polyprenyl synthetase family protein [Zetaproteobacteria bacterium]|nr:MAG: polyprenyl synthetase family protein [Zetaproteobacteria bacterium]